LLQFVTNCYNLAVGIVVKKPDIIVWKKRKKRTNL